MKPFTDLQRRQLAAALAGHQFEFTDDARIFVPKHKVMLGGVFTTDKNGGDKSIDPNLVVNEGLVDILVVYFQQGSQRTAFYMAPFSGNVAPANGLTAATFASTQTEFTNYSEASRVPWTPPAAPVTTPTVGNSASVATITVNADNQSVWGFGLLTAQAKGAVTGVLVAAAQFSKVKNVDSGDKLNSTYSFTAADAGA